mmetsp:Transcript_112976/g.314372  ORF Transcript_112976/g.314372 Transcript_112976/m.314372 type:complete len:220 (+) Transcript_112976:230-889(+)
MSRNGGGTTKSMGSSSGTNLHASWASSLPEFRSSPLPRPVASPSSSSSTSRCSASAPSPTPCSQPLASGRPRVVAPSCIMLHSTGFGVNQEPTTPTGTPSSTATAVFSSILGLSSTGVPAESSTSCGGASSCQVTLFRCCGLAPRSASPPLAAAAAGVRVVARRRAASSSAARPARKACADGMRSISCPSSLKICSPSAEEAAPSLSQACQKPSTSWSS